LRRRRTRKSVSPVTHCPPATCNNPDGAALLHERMSELFACEWLPTGPIAPVLGAHTGPGLVGLVYASRAAFGEEMP
jgi:fatty acid-binding protein DegV